MVERYIWLLVRVSFGHSEKVEREREIVAAAAARRIVSEILHGTWIIRGQALLMRICGFHNNNNFMFEIVLY